MEAISKMKKEIEKQAKKADNQKERVDKDTVRKNVQMDLSAAVAFLNFIRNDQEFTEHIVELAYRKMNETPKPPVA